MEIEDIEYEVLGKLPFHDIVKYRESLGVSYQTNQPRTEKIIRSTRSHIKNLILDRRVSAAREISPLNEYDIRYLVENHKENLILLHGLRKLTYSNTPKEYWSDLYNYASERYITTLFDDMVKLLGLDLDVIERDPDILKDIKVVLDPNELREIRIPLEYIDVLLELYEPKELFIHWGNSVWSGEIGKYIAGRMDVIDNDVTINKIYAAYITEDDAVIDTNEDFIKLASLRDSQFYNKVIKKELVYVDLECIRYDDVVYEYPRTTFIDLVASRSVPLTTLEGYHPLVIFEDLFGYSEFEAAVNFMELYNINNKELDEIMSHADTEEYNFMTYKTFQFLKDKIKGRTLLNLLPKDRFYYRLFINEYPDWVFDFEEYPVEAFDLLKDNHLQRPGIESLIKRCLVKGSSLAYDKLSKDQKESMLGYILRSGNLDIIKNHNVTLNMLVDNIYTLDCSVMEYYIVLYPQLLDIIIEKAKYILVSSVSGNNSFNILWMHNRGILPDFPEKNEVEGVLSDIVNYAKQQESYNFYLVLKGIKDSKSNV